MRRREPPPRAAKRLETARIGERRRGTQYGGRRGRARDKMAAGGKLAAENHGDRSAPRSRALSSRRPNSPALVRRVWTMALKSQTLRHYTREILIFVRRSAITIMDRDATRRAKSSTARKHSPSHGPARRAMSPANARRDFPSPRTRSARSRSRVLRTTCSLT